MVLYIILGLKFVLAPGGYKFYLEPSPLNALSKVTLAASNLEKSIEYWNGLLGMKVSDNMTWSLYLGTLVKYGSQNSQHLSD
jgi:hypothetical protein